MKKEARAPLIVANATRNDVMFLEPKTGGAG